MKVLHVFPVSEIGGGETVLLNLMRFRQRPTLEHEALLVATEDGPLGAELSAMGIAWSRVPRGRMRDPRALWHACAASRQRIVTNMPDVWISNSAQGYLYGRLATMGLGLPGALYQMSVPETDWWKNGPLDWLTAIGKPDVVFAASETIRRRMATWGFASLETVYHGTAVPTCNDDDRARVARELTSRAISPDAPMVLMPGRLQPWKGQRLFLQAFISIAERFPNAHAVCLGSAMFGQDAQYPRELAEAVEASGLAHRVHLIPHQPVAAWLDRATVVVHASLAADAFPNVCIEALACRRALITNTLAGTSEILRHGESAMVVPANNPTALADAMGVLLDNPTLRAAVADAGHQQYLRTCTPAHMVEPIEHRLLDVSRRAHERLAS